MFHVNLQGSTLNNYDLQIASVLAGRQVPRFTDAKAFVHLGEGGIVQPDLFICLLYGDLMSRKCHGVFVCVYIYILFYCKYTICTNLTYGKTLEN